MKNRIKCPLCGGLALVNSEVTSDKDALTDMTYAWKCIDCPFVGFEYYEPANIDTLHDIIK